MILLLVDDNEEDDGREGISIHESVETLARLFMAHNASELWGSVPSERTPRVLDIEAIERLLAVMECWVSRSFL